MHGIRRVFNLPKVLGCFSLSFFFLRGGICEHLFRHRSAHCGSGGLGLGSVCQGGEAFPNLGVLKPESINICMKLLESLEQFSHVYFEDSGRDKCKEKDNLRSQIIFLSF